MERWLVSTNCNTPGLANSFRLMATDVEVVDVYMESLENWIGERDGRETFSVAFVHPLVLAREQTRDSLEAIADRVVAVPHITFAGYHPDLCYVQSNGTGLGGPLGDYHSAICVAAFRAGLSAGDAARLYNYKTYERAGYLDTWDLDRDAHLDDFRSHGLDLSEEFVAWAKRGPFMYSINHPAMMCISDVARKVLGKLDRPTSELQYLPIDNLAYGPWFPVYPEIAECCGVKGSLSFKVNGEFSMMSLEQFIASSYALYASAGPHEVHNILGTWSRFSALTDTIGWAA